MSKVLLVILGTPLLLFDASLLVQYQLSPWSTARDLAASYPYLDRIPIVPPDKSVAILQGERIERFGFSMHLPWKDIYRDTTLQDVALISSNNGGAIEIHPASARHDSGATMRLMADEVAALRDNQSLRTNYALTVAAMGAKPAQVKWWKTRGQNAKDVNLLLMKLLVESDCQGPLYAIQFGEMRGFQPGNPSAAPYCAKLDLFDGADRLYEIRIDEYPERAPVITQAEINAMVASVRPISPQLPNTTVLKNDKSFIISMLRRT
jgi:hypothetical protein